MRWFALASSGQRRQIPISCPCKEKCFFLRTSLGVQAAAFREHARNISKGTIASTIFATCLPCKISSAFSIHHDVTAPEQVATVRRALCALTGVADRSVSARAHGPSGYDGVVRQLHILIAGGERTAAVRGGSCRKAGSPQAKGRAAW